MWNRPDQKRQCPEIPGTNRHDRFRFWRFYVASASNLLLLHRAFARGREKPPGLGRNRAGNKPLGVKCNAVPGQTH